MKLSLGFMLVALTVAGCATKPNFQDRTREVFKAHERDILSCYESRLDKEPNLEGEIILAFDVETDGSVSNAKIDADKSAPALAEVGKCVIAKLETWKFPKHSHRRGMALTYPLRFYR
jgi:hypothetical protein